MRILALALFAVFALVAQAMAATPVPGGANQIAGVNGKMNQTLFNGMIRWKMTAIREPVPADNLGDPHSGMRWLVFVAKCSNGLHGTYIGLPQVTLLDAQDNSYHSEDHNTSPAPVNVIQGQAWNERLAVEVPADFAPTKAVITDPANALHFKAMRIAISPKDLPGRP